MRHITQNGDKVFLLVVEDSPTQAEELRFFLEESDYDVMVCHDGQEAFEWLQDSDKKPDVVISDIQMPRMDGYTLCKAIRNEEAFKGLPIILLTSLSDPQDIIKSIDAGANKFLTKPFDHKRLPELVNELYINTKRRSSERMEVGIRLFFGGDEFLITADKVQILDLLLSSYEEIYFQNHQLQQTRSELEALNAQLEQKVQERTKQLREQEEQFRMLAEHSPDIIARINRNMNITYVNKAMETILGIPPSELIGLPFSYIEKRYPSCAPCSEAVVSLFQDHKEKRLEYYIETDNGIRWLDSTLVPEFGEEEHVDYALSVARDITLQKESEKLLYIKDQAIDSSMNAIAMADLEGKMTYVNNAFIKLWRVKDTAEVLGQDVLSFWKEKERAAEALQAIRIGGMWEGELRGEKLNGEPIDVHALTQIVHDKEKNPVAYIAYFKDITEEKRAKEELKQKEEMMLIQSKQAAMGDMIAMIAHQWRQPITVISMAANNLKLNLELEEEITEEALKKMLTTVTKQTQHLSKTIDDFRNFFKPDKKKETTTIKEVLDNTLQIIGKSLENNNITLDIRDHASSEVTIVANELLQVFLNVLNNAKDALKENANENAKINVDIDENEHFVTVNICDNAGGIPEDAMKRLGEPYFSTKGKNGTGLGIYMSKTIMEKHLHGELTWKNSGEGACFTLTIAKNRG